MKYGVYNFPVRHLSHLDETDENGKFQAVVHCHSHNFLRSLNVTEGRILKVRHCLKRLLMSFTSVNVYLNHIS